MFLYEVHKLPLRKQLALAVSIVLFVLAAVISVLQILPKKITVELKERNTIAEDKVFKTIDGISPLESVGTALLENGYDIKDSYTTDIDLDTKAYKIDTIALSKNVDGNVTLDGNTIPFCSGSKTVGGVLDELELNLNESDIVEPDRSTPLTHESSQIVVTRCSTVDEEREEVIPFETTFIEDPSLISNSIFIDTEGRDGRKKIKERITYDNGIETARELLEESIIENPTAQVVRIGIGTNTQSVTVPNLPSASSDVASRSTIAKTTVNANGVIDTTSQDSYARPVNSAYPLDPGYVPYDLVDMGYGDSKMRRAAADAFNQMKQDCLSSTGQELLPISCFRNYATQSSISGNVGTAGAGYSEHQTGLAVDLGITGYDSIDKADHFEQTQAFQWLQAHAHEYGFCNSYPANTIFGVGFEPWHWRFLGSDLAPVVRQAQINGTAAQYDDWVEANKSFNP